MADNSMTALDKAAGFNTVLSLVQLGGEVFSALSSDDPGMALLGILGLNFGEEPAYSLEDLRDEIIAEFQQQNDLMGLIALTSATAKTEQVKQQMTMYHEDPSQVSVETIIETADAAIFEAMEFGSTLLEQNSSPLTIAAAISAVTEALTARMAVVEVAQDGAWGMKSVMNIVKDAQEFFTKAQAAYAYVHDAYVENIDIGSVVFLNPHGSSSFTFYADRELNERAVELATEIDGLEFHATPQIMYDAMAQGVMPIANGSFSFDSWVVVKQGPLFDALKLANHGFLDQRLPNDTTDDVIHFNMSQARDAMVITRYIEEQLKIAQAEKEGYTVELVESIGLLANTFSSVIDGETLSDTSDNPSDGNGEYNGKDGKDFVNAGDHNDIISGNGGRDVLKGGSGADTIDGGEGSDTLFGGLNEFGNDYDGDKDIFVFKNLGDVDVIKEFEATGEQNADGTWQPDFGDLIQIDVAAFGASNMEKGALDAIAFSQGHANVTEDTLILQDGSSLYFDVDGSGEFDAYEQFATIGVDLTHGNFEFI